MKDALNNNLLKIIFGITLFFLIILGLTVFFKISLLTGGKELHFWIEYFGGLIAITFSIIAFLEYRKTLDKLFMIAGLGFLANGLIDVLHAIISNGFIQLPYSSMNVFIIGTGVAGRALLGIILCSVFLVKEWRTSEKEIIPDLAKWIGLIVIVSLIITALFSLFAMPVFLIQKIFFINNPKELIPAIFLTIALTKFYKIAKQEKKTFKSLLVISIVLGIIAQIYMSVIKPIDIINLNFNSLFMLGHLIKDLSYLTVLLILFIPEKKIWTSVIEND